MSNPAYLPLFPSDYLKDTRHLSTEEHGAYLLMLMTAWTQGDCSLPDDDTKLARVCGLTLRKWRLLRPTMEEFWTIEGGRWRNARLTRERIYVDQKSQSNRENSRKRWDKQTTENKQKGSSRRISNRNAPQPQYKEIESKASISTREKAKNSEANFPRPDFADPKVWEDFLRNRKAKRLPNTETAYKGFLDDIARLSTPEWTPSRLLTHAVTKGWGGIYEPRELQAHDRPVDQQRASRAVEDIGRDVAARLERQAERDGSGGTVVHLPRPRSAGWPD